MPKWLSPIFPVETLATPSGFGVAESVRRLQASTEPPHFSSVVRPAVVGVCTDSNVQLWVQDRTLGVGRVNRFRPRLVGALREHDGKATFEGRIDLTAFGVFAMSIVAVVLISVLVGLFSGDEPRVFRALIGAFVALSVALSRRQYRDDVEVLRQTLEAALRRAPNRPLQPASSAAQLAGSDRR